MAGPRFSPKIKGHPPLVLVTCDYGASALSQRRSSNRYFSADDFEVGVTRSRLKRLGKDRQCSYLVGWFNARYEDPAQEMPWNGQEGGFQYIYGGPYDARDELSREFGGLVSDEVIERAVEEVESGGIVYWAPGREHSDHERARADYESDRQADEDEDFLDLATRYLDQGHKPTYGSVEERRLRSQILEEIARLKIVSTPPVFGGIGHNNPPLDEADLSPELIPELHEAAEVIEAELTKAEPDALEVARATGRLKEVLSWFGKKLDVAVESFVKEAGGAAGKTAGASGVLFAAYEVAQAAPTLKSLVSTIVVHAALWLSHVALPF